MCHVLKLLGQLLHGQFGLGLSLKLRKLPQNLAATEGTQHRLARLQETARHGELRLYFTYNTEVGGGGLQTGSKPVCMKRGMRFLRLPANRALCYHFPEEGGHLTAVLQDGPDEEGGPRKETSLLSIQAVATQELASTLR